jgi:hypothetical protein
MKTAVTYCGTADIFIVFAKVDGRKFTSSSSKRRRA